MSAREPPQYTPNHIFLLDHAGKLSTDDSEPMSGCGGVFPKQECGGRAKYRQRMLMGMIVVVFASLIVGGIGWRRGLKSDFLFAIHGPSMAPTLLGEHRIASCVACGFDWPVTISDDDTPAVCFHCGDQARVANSAHVASLVVVRPYEQERTGGSRADALRSGDVIAIGGQEMLRIKRIAAVPGDIVDLNGVSLLVNGEPMAQRMSLQAELKVPISVMRFEMDDRREISRWQGEGWKRSSQRAWKSAARNWLIYHHRSIHERNQASCVWDDYPYNVGLNRKLYPANRIVFTSKAVCQGQGLLEVVFWVGDRAVGITCEVEGKCELNISSDEAAAVQVAPVSAEAPVAIRVLAGSVQLSCLQLGRQVEYRLRPHDDPACYPIELGSDEYFVVGDNVPTSSDSRDFGVIEERTIKGRVELSESP